MYIATNRFLIAPGREDDFETIWRERDSRLADVAGFRSFALLRGAQSKDHTLYLTHTIWDDEAVFRDWTRSEHFREAHKGVGDHRDIYLAAPVFEGFEARLTEAHR